MNILKLLHLGFLLFFKSRLYISTHVIFACLYEDLDKEILNSNIWKINKKVTAHKRKSKKIFKSDNF